MRQETKRVVVPEVVSYPEVKEDGEILTTEVTPVTEIVSVTIRPQEEWNRLPEIDFP
jgi:hypothetical protein